MKLTEAAEAVVNRTLTPAELSELI
jgi:hypothetical protein